MRKVLIILFVMFLFLPLIMAPLDVSLDSYKEKVSGVNIDLPTEPINYSLIPTVNSSDFWDDNDIIDDTFPTTDARYLMLDGSNSPTTGDITFGGNILNDGNPRAIGSIADPWQNGFFNVLSANSLFSLGGSMISDLKPLVANSFNLGTSIQSWENLWVDNINSEVVTSDVFTSPFVEGSIVFSNADNFSEDNANLFWDDGNDRLGVGTNSPKGTLHVGVGADDPQLANPSIYVTKEGSTSLSIRNSAANIELAFGAWNNHAFFGTRTPQEFRIQTNAQNRMVVETAAGGGEWFRLKSNSDVYFPLDNQKIYWGAAQDYSIEWDGNDVAHTITAGDFVFTGGNTGWGTATPQTLGHFFVSDVPRTPQAGTILTLEDAGATGSGITLLADSAKYSFINFADNDSTNSGQIFYNHNGNSMSFKAGGQSKLFISSGSFTVNEDGNDVDSRWESANDVFAFFIRGSDGAVTFGTSAPRYKLETVGEITDGYFGVSSNSTNHGDIFSIDDAFNVGINTTKPTHRLNVVGSANVTGELIIGTSDNFLNITMYSPNGSSWTCGVNNTGSFLCS